MKKSIITIAVLLALISCKNITNPTIEYASVHGTFLAGWSEDSSPLNWQASLGMDYGDSLYYIHEMERIPSNIGTYFQFDSIPIINTAANFKVLMVAYGSSSIYADTNIVLVPGINEITIYRKKSFWE